MTNIKMFTDALQTAYDSNIKGLWNFDITMKNNTKWNILVGSGRRYSITYIPGTPMQDTWKEQVKYYLENNDISKVTLRAISYNPLKEKEFNDITMDLLEYFENLRISANIKLKVKILQNNIIPTMVRSA